MERDAHRRNSSGNLGAHLSRTPAADKISVAIDSACAVTPIPTFPVISRTKTVDPPAFAHGACPAVGVAAQEVPAKIARPVITLKFTFPSGTPLVPRGSVPLPAGYLDAEEVISR